MQSSALLTELILPTLLVVVEVEHKHKKSHPFYNLCLFPKSTSSFCVSFTVLSLCVMNFQCLHNLDFFDPFVKLYEVPSLILNAMNLALESKQLVIYGLARED